MTDNKISMELNMMYSTSVPESSEQSTCSHDSTFADHTTAVTLWLIICEGDITRMHEVDTGAAD